MRSLVLLVAAVLIAASPSLAQSQNIFFDSRPPVQQQELENPEWDWVEKAPFHESLVSVHGDTGCRGSGVLVAVEPEVKEIESKGVVANYRVGYILTCFHVATSSRKPNGITIKYMNSCKVQASIYWMHSDLDICLLRAMVPVKYEPCKVAEGFSYGGDTAVVLGLGGSGTRIDKEDSIRRFRITLSEMTGRWWLRADECLVPGDSGGPVFNSDNELIGLCCMGHESFRKLGRDRAVWPGIFCGSASVRLAMKGLPMKAKVQVRG